MTSLRDLLGRTSRACRQTLGVSMCLVLGLSGCAVNPVTGTPEVSFMSLEEELEIGEKAARQIEEQVGLVKDESIRAYIEEVGARVAAKSPRQEVTYRFNTLDLEVPNAFTLPGGYIYVSRGLLALVNSEAELANVLGHEVGHVAARHASADSWREATVGVLSGLGSIAGALIGLGGVSEAAGASFLASHSRDQENQADEVGQMLAAEAGWDPLAMSEFLRALDRDTTIRENAVKQANFLDSHPVTTERIETTSKRASSLAIQSSDSPALARDAFLQKLEGLVVGQDPRSGVFIDKRLFLHRDLNFRVRFPEDWQTVNAPSFVGASDGAVKVELTLQGDGDDGRKAAKEYFERLEDEREAAAAKGEKLPPELTQSGSGPRLISRRRTAYTVEATTQRGQLSVLMYWIPLPAGMFRLTCTVATPLLAQYERDCRATAGSLRTLRRSDPDRIEFLTLQLDRALRDESLREFNDRVENAWNVAQTAAVNGLSLPYDLEEGQLIKYARKTLYVPEARDDAAVPGEQPDDASEDEAPSED